MYFRYFLYFVTYLVAIISLYRVAAFVHEILHQKNNPSFNKYFTWLWNLTAGLFILLPSPTFNAHLNHHKVDIFGTHNDEQYVLINGVGGWKHQLLLFLALPYLLPIACIIRVCLYPIDAIFKTSIQTKFYSLLYKKQKFSESDIKLLRLSELYYFIITVVFGCICWHTPKLFLVWYWVSFGAWFLSAMRIPLEHSLAVHNDSVSFENQIEDSFNRPNGILGLIIQPLGLNRHKDHHKNPNKPYYLLNKK